jgi:hypothetical protein
MLLRCSSSRILQKSAEHSVWLQAARGHLAFEVDASALEATRHRADSVKALIEYQFTRIAHVQQGETGWDSCVSRCRTIPGRWEFYALRTLTLTETRYCLMAAETSQVMVAPTEEDASRLLLRCRQVSQRVHLHRKRSEGEWDAMREEIASVSQSIREFTTKVQS